MEELGCFIGSNDYAQTSVGTCHDRPLASPEDFDWLKPDYWSVWEEPVHCSGAISLRRCLAGQGIWTLTPTDCTESSHSDTHLTIKVNLRFRTRYCFSLPCWKIAQYDTVIEASHQPCGDKRGSCCWGYCRYCRSHLHASEIQYTNILNLIQAVLYLICQIVFNVFLHPLRKFPGPRSRAAFAFLNYLDEIRGEQAEKAKSLHDKYGSVVRIGPKSLSFNTARAWRGMFFFCAQ